MKKRAGRKPTIDRKQGDLVPTQTRLPETMRDELKAAADEYATINKGI